MASIENYVTPSRLYRYRPVEHLERELDAIESGYLYCAPFIKLNDPMEGVFTSSRHLKESTNYRETRRGIAEGKFQIGICSFSEVYDHELMWAHYADKYKGICIAYNLSRLQKTLNDDITFVRMYYNEREPTVHRSRKPPREIAKMVLSYKNYRWLYEREWRMFARVGKQYYTDRSCVSRVYLGSRMSRKIRERTTERLGKLRIAVKIMTIDKYFIDFVNAAEGDL